MHIPLFRLLTCLLHNISLYLTIYRIYYNTNTNLLYLLLYLYIYILVLKLGKMYHVLKK